VRTILPILCAALLSSCADSSKRVVQADSAMPTVAVARVTRQDLGRELTLAAEFRPYQEVDLHAKVAGYLKQINVDVGDHAQAGQLIAILEIPEMVDDAVEATATKKRSESELIRAQSEVVRAQSAHEAAHLAYQRLADVAKSRPNLIARQELDDGQAKDRIAEAQVDTAKAAVVSAEQQLRVVEAAEQRVHTLEAYARITAPFAGVISKRYADTGAMIQAGTSSSSQAMPLVRLSQVDRLRLVIPVPESAVPQIRVGVPIAIRVTTVGRQIEGRVSRFSDRLQTSTRTMETEVDVPNTHGDLAPGMYAEAVLTLDHRQNALSVPIQAVTGAESKTTLFVVGPQQQLEQRVVTLGLETADRREVISGLSEGDSVVMGKTAALRPGDRVQPREVN